VATPESIALIFYGENAQAMFEAMEQFLSDHLIFAGAVVSIRQGKGVRQVVIPTIVNQVTEHSEITASQPSNLSRV
jgi:hypothetical protein